MNPAQPTEPPTRHAMVLRDGYRVPLIGIPAEAALEECDLCHQQHALDKLTWTGAQMLCAKCAGSPQQPSSP